MPRTSTPPPGARRPLTPLLGLAPLLLCAACLPLLDLDRPFEEDLGPAEDLSPLPDMPRDMPPDPRRDMPRDMVEDLAPDLPFDASPDMPQPVDMKQDLPQRVRGGLLISEVYEGTSGNDKALELYNDSDATISLDDVLLINMNMPAYENAASASLKGLSLPPDGVLLLCHTDFADNARGELLPCVTSSEGATSFNNVIIFNGDDPLALLEDANQDGFDLSDPVIDAFGALDKKPSAQIWKDRVYRRCGLTSYDGSPPFPIAMYYTLAINADDTSQLGLPPQMTACP